MLKDWTCFYGDEFAFVILMKVVVVVVIVIDFEVEIGFDFGSVDEADWSMKG